MTELIDIPFGGHAGDVNHDGTVDITDTGQIQTWINTTVYDARGDLDRDSDVDNTDRSIPSGYAGRTLGLGVLSYADANGGNRRGYAGYEFEPVSANNLYQVRYRWLNSQLGRWSSRDHFGYLDGPSLYTCVHNCPLVFRDALGTRRTSVSGAILPPPDLLIFPAEPWLSPIRNWIENHNWPLNSVVCNDTSTPMLISSNGCGCGLIAPGKCSNPVADCGDFYYYPPTWYKCGWDTCHPTDADPADGNPVWNPITDGLLDCMVEARDCLDTCGDPTSPNYAECVAECLLLIPMGVD